MVITELDKDRLSVLQRDLLVRALLALHPGPIDQGCKEPYAGCLELKAIMRTETDRAKRAVRRAAAGRAVARLVKRGLLEYCARGKWRLTETGIEVAKVLQGTTETARQKSRGVQ
jgi:hypothetical protein